jgi:group I intron endonuclease
MHTIYRVTNRVNGHTYIGVTRTSLALRWYGHVSTALRRPRSYLHRAIAKYGAEAFHVEPIASVLSEPWTVEQAIIKQWLPTYNQTNGGESTRGRRIPPEVAARIAASNTGKKRTPEQKAAAAIVTKARWERNPAFRKIAIEALLRGRKRVNKKKRLAAIRKAYREKVWTPEERMRWSAALRVQPYRSPKKAVHCIELAAAFDCAQEAAEGTGVTMSCVRHQCLYGTRRRKPTNGLTFEYV